MKQRLRSSLRKAHERDLAIRWHLPMLPKPSCRCGLLSLPGQRLLVTEGMGQAVQVGMGQVRLLYQWRGFTLPGLGLGGRQLGGLQGLLQPGLLFAEHALLAKMGTDLFGQRA